MQLDMGLQVTLHPWKLTALRKAVAVETRAKASPTKAMLRENRSQKAKTREKERTTPVMSLVTKSGKGKAGSNQGKKGGKGAKGADKACYVCGKTGHCARDCWNNQNVRNIQGGNQGQQDQGQPSAQSSPQAQSQHSQAAQFPQAIQFRVSRISELVSVAEDDTFACDSHGQFVFDLRDSPKSSQSPQNSIRAVHFFIGDDDEERATQTGSIRAVVSEIPDDGELHSILLDSGADATVLPATFLGAGSKVPDEVSKLHDAQGGIIPVQDMHA